MLRLLMISVAFLGLEGLTAVAENGEQVFTKYCAACHSVGGGRLVGPDLANLHKKRSKAWTRSFIKSSQAMIKAGDAEAKKVFDEYNGIIMPDQPVNDDQIDAILKFIEKKSGSVKAVKKKEKEWVVTEADVALGRDLFQGKARFSAGGPSCISCHDVKNDAIIGGGVLAVELTSVFSKMGGEGVKAILGNIPFPVMERAYRDRPFTEKEIVALVSFLKKADKDQFYQTPRDYGYRLFFTGLAGLAFLLGFFSLFGWMRKKRSVNQDIYDRQIKSETSDDWQD